MKYLLIVLSLAATFSCRDTKEPVPAPAIMAMDKMYAAVEEKKPETIFDKRKLITTGEIQFKVADVDSARSFIQELVGQSGGYISSDEQRTYPGLLRVNQSVRIPADKLDDFISKLNIIAKSITTKEFNTEDVTAEYIDNKSRLVTKRELEKRYREILNHANKVVDMLQVEQQLANVRGDIESMEGRLQYITNQSAFSSLALGYSEDIPVKDEFKFGSALIQSIGNGWHNLELFLLKLIDQWPFILTSIIVFILIYRWVRIKIQSFRKVSVTV